MARRTIISLIDDLDGESEADETVEYALDGVTYEIDLSSDHAEELREVFAPYIDGRPAYRWPCSHRHQQSAPLPQQWWRRLARRRIGCRWSGPRSVEGDS